MMHTCGFAVSRDKIFQYSIDFYPNSDYTEIRHRASRGGIFVTS